MVIYRYGRKLPIECRISGPGQEPFTVRIGTVEASSIDTTTTSVSTPTTMSGATRVPAAPPVQCLHLLVNSQSTSDVTQTEPSLLRPEVSHPAVRPAVSHSMSSSTTPANTTAQAIHAHKTLTDQSKPSTTPSSSRNVKHPSKHPL